MFPADSSSPSCPQKPTKTDKRRPNRHGEQKHEAETEKIREDRKHKHKDAAKTRLLAEDQPLAETAGVPSEKLLVHSSLPGDSPSPAGDKVPRSQSSTEGIGALSSQCHTPRCSPDKDVGRETGSVDDHNSFRDKVLGPRNGPAGDVGTLLLGFDIPVSVLRSGRRH